MVVAVIDEVIGYGVSMLGIELLEHALGVFLLLIADLLEELVGLIAPECAQVVSLEIDMREALQLIQLVGPDWRLIGSSVREMDGLVDLMGIDPGLGWNRDAGMPYGDSPMCRMEFGVGESGPGNPNGGTGAAAPDRVMRSRPSKAQGRTLLPNVPSDTGENLYRTLKTKKTHGFKSEGSSQKVCGNTA
jgi:hypothetical protein